MLKDVGITAAVVVGILGALGGGAWWLVARDKAEREEAAQRLDAFEETAPGLESAPELELDAYDGVVETYFLAPNDSLALCFDVFARPRDLGPAVVSAMRDEVWSPAGFEAAAERCEQTFFQRPIARCEVVDDPVELRQGTVEMLTVTYLYDVRDVERIQVSCVRDGGRFVGSAGFAPFPEDFMGNR